MRNVDTRFPDRMPDDDLVIRTALLYQRLRDEEVSITQEALRQEDMDERRKLQRQAKRLDTARQLVDNALDTLIDRLPQDIPLIDLRDDEHAEWHAELKELGAL